MIEKRSIQAFLELAVHYPILDVRSPSEFSHAHIPGAFSMPLFSDEERKVVGTAYKQQSRETAIKIGLDFFGPKMRKMVEQAEELMISRNSSEKHNGAEQNGYQHPTNSRIILIHCWRGGMRSAAIAWLLDLYGFKVYTLAGGYKAFRNFVLEQFEKSYPFRVIGGYTGSGKTEVLKALQQRGALCIDLEGLANHKGSAFGNLGQPPQPSQEMFENMLAMELIKKMAKQPPIIWMEDESQRIGNVNIPPSIFRQKQTSEVYFLDIPFQERLSFIVIHYGNLPKEQLLNAIVRIKKRLGGLETKTAVNFLLEDDVRNCFAVLLAYYDKWYLKGLHNKEGIEKLVHACPIEKVDVVLSIQRIQEQQEVAG